MKHTPAQLKRVHIALLGQGTTLKALAKAFGYDYQELSRQLKAWRKRNDTKTESARLS